MYKYVNNATVQPNKIKHLLCRDSNIDAFFDLIGSSAKKLVTQNEVTSFDMVYNLEIQNHSIEHLDAKELKTVIMSLLNEIPANQNWPFSDSQDSAAVITSRWIDKENKKLRFSFDVAILIKNINGVFCRMIYDKQNGRYFWTEILDSQDVSNKMRLSKKNG